jgi:hypothetical protein
LGRGGGNGGRRDARGRDRRGGFGEGARGGAEGAEFGGLAVLLGAEAGEFIGGALLVGGLAGAFGLDRSFGALAFDFALEALAVFAELALGGFVGGGGGEGRGDECEKDESREGSREEVQARKFGDRTEVHR